MNELDQAIAACKQLADGATNIAAYLASLQGRQADAIASLEKSLNEASVNFQQAQTSHFAAADQVVSLTKELDALKVKYDPQVKADQEKADRAKLADLQAQAAALDARLNPKK